MRRTVISFVILATLAIVIVVTTYTFNFSFDLSDDSSKWAEFGSYFGGVLSPIVATLALLALCITIEQQTKQISLLNKQVNLSDMKSSIEKTEADFVETLKAMNLTFENDNKDTYTCYDSLIAAAFPHWEKVVPLRESIHATKEYDFASNEIKLFEVYGAAAGHLNQLRIYVNMISEVSDNNIVSKYYERKYKVAYTRLVKQGYLEEGKWIIV
jgi:hypothetical protein